MIDYGHGTTVTDGVDIDVGHSTSVDNRDVDSETKGIQ